jgi:hypothetical protein
MLQDFINHYQIDEKALESIKHRLMIVGRFSQTDRTQDPDVYLFTNKPDSDLPDAFKAKDGIFKDRRPLAYEKFVELLRPSLAERVEFEEDLPVEAQIPKIRQYVPRDYNDAREGTAVVDTFHYLFLRAISSTKQGTELNNMRPHLPSELALLGNRRQHAGKGIFKLFRKELNVFALFQPQTHLIVDAMSQLLSTCARQNDMPQYAHGAPLPPGFPEKLIDYVYAEDAGSKFSLEGLDLSSPPWSQLTRNRAAGRMFQNVVSAFRDAILGLEREQFGMIKFAGRTLDQQARDLFSGQRPDIKGSKERKELREQFGRARDAFNTLRQLLRSKAIIALILDWLLKSYYQLPQVSSQGSEHEQDAAAATAILHGAHNVAPPVLRPSKEAQDEFGTRLTLHFEKLLMVLYEKDEVFEQKLLEALPDLDLQKLARELRAKPLLVKTLARIATPTADSDTREAFINSAKVVLLDVLCPVLFDQPVLTEDQLRRIFRQQTMAAYLTAIFLARSNKDEVGLIGRKNIEYFKSKIDKKTYEIEDMAEIEAKFLGEFIELIASEKIQRQLQEGLDVLREAQTILANIPAGSGAGAISAVRPDPDIQKNATLEVTAVRPADVEVSLRELVKKLVRSEPRVVELRQKARAVAQAAAAIPGAQAALAPEGVAIEPEAADVEPGAPVAIDAIDTPGRGMLGDSEIGKAASSKVKQVLDRLLAGREPGAVAAPVTLDEQELAKEASELLLGDQKTMKDVQKAVKAYEQILFLIYQRYAENQGNKIDGFSNGVDRLTLVNMMLLSQKELGLGTVSSNLLQLLMDMVEHLDRENPDPMSFIRKVSLTRYFDNKKLDLDGDVWGITNLRKTLEAQYFDNLEETQAFVSELWGIRYLMGKLKNDDRSEVIVVNATADEFISWIRRNSLSPHAEAGGNFQLKKLLGVQAGECIQPGLVYLTDSAFPLKAPPTVDEEDDAKRLQREQQSAKEHFVRSLSGMNLCNEQLRVLLPPMCISTPGFGEEGWSDVGRSVATAAMTIPAPVAIVGPSAFLNNPSDYFRTYLPAGYMFAVHFLSKSTTQSIIIDNVAASSQGRFRVVGYSPQMHETLDSVLWPLSHGDTYGFAVDYYLYMILTILAAASGGAAPPTDIEATAYYANFFRNRIATPLWRGSCDVVSKFLVDGTGAWFSFAQSIAQANSSLGAVLVDKQGLEDNAAGAISITDVGWFNLARIAARVK